MKLFQIIYGLDVYVRRLCKTKLIDMEIAFLTLALIIRLKAADINSATNFCFICMSIAGLNPLAIFINVARHVK